MGPCCRSSPDPANRDVTRVPRGKDRWIVAIAPPPPSSSRHDTVARAMLPSAPSTSWWIAQEPSSRLNSQGAAPAAWAAEAAAMQIDIKANRLMSLPPS
jgi:hypothetical protein